MERASKFKNLCRNQLRELLDHATKVREAKAEQMRRFRELKELRKQQEEEHLKQEKRLEERRRSGMEKVSSELGEDRGTGKGEVG